MIPPLPENILVRLKDQILLKLKIDQFNLRKYITNFVTTIFSNETPSKMHYIIINMVSEFINKKMTIKVFFKFLSVIGAKKITFSVTIVTFDNRVVEVSEEVELNVDPELFKIPAQLKDKS